MLWTVLSISLLGLASATAQTNIRYTSGTYSSSPRVSFTVSWMGANRGDKGNGKIYNSKVWVLIDYKKSDGSWERATIASLNSATQGTLSFDGSNRRGFWLNGGSGNVTSQIIVTLSGVPSKFSWCAYVSDRPPVAYITSSDVRFSGTPPFTVKYSDNSSGTFTNKTGNVVIKAIVSLTDKTDCPSSDVQCMVNTPTLSGANFVTKGTTTQITANPTGGSWNTDNATIATVNTSGVVTGVLIGHATISYSITQKGCASSATKDIVIITPIVPCSNTFNFGTVSFTSSETVTVSGNGITQYWSMPVIASGCRKTSFNGGSSAPYNVDCRSNNGSSTTVNYTYGDLFSWCAVNNYQTTLCPNGWRMPTKDDFVNLDKALGGTGENRGGANTFAKYTATSGTSGQFWKGQYGGVCNNSGGLGSQTTHGLYWSVTEATGTYGYGLYFYTADISVYPLYNNGSPKNFGYSLRCIRN